MLSVLAFVLALLFLGWKYDPECVRRRDEKRQRQAAQRHLQDMCRNHPLWFQQPKRPDFRNVVASIKSFWKNQ